MNDQSGVPNLAYFRLTSVNIMPWTYIATCVCALASIGYSPLFHVTV